MFSNKLLDRLEMKKDNNVVNSNCDTNVINSNYKDSLFRKVFSEKEDLLDLYNAISGRNCKCADELTIFTLEDVLYISRKNDISFIIEDVLNLYEHQSTLNPNMPIRGLIYLAKNLEAYISLNNINVHSTKLQKFPIPQYIVFYNGNDKMEDKIEFHLKDAFVNVDSMSPCIDLIATCLNINYGHNNKILEKCKKLNEYSIFVSKIKARIREGRNLSDLLDEVIDNCIEQGILKEILLKQRGEVRSMVLNYTREKHEYFMRLEGREDAREQINKLNSILIEQERYEDIKRASVDSDYQDKLLEEFGLSFE